MKALLVGTLNQEKALIGTFSSILKSSGTFISSSSLEMKVVVSHIHTMNQSPVAVDWVRDDVPHRVLLALQRGQKIQTLAPDQPTL